jgi:transposase-like protein
MIVCPRCRSNTCKELYRSKQDTIDELDHSHFRCEQCGNEFNHWNEPDERLRKVFGDSYRLYCVEKMF